jgi:hypothetical protein
MTVFWRVTVAVGIKDNLVLAVWGSLDEGFNFGQGGIRSKLKRGEILLGSWARIWLLPEKLSVVLLTVCDRLPIGGTRSVAAGKEEEEAK